MVDESGGPSGSKGLSIFGTILEAGRIVLVNWRVFLITLVIPVMHGLFWLLVLLIMIPGDMGLLEFIRDPSAIQQSDVMKLILRAPNTFITLTVIAGIAGVLIFLGIFVLWIRLGAMGDERAWRQSIWRWVKQSALVGLWLLAASLLTGIVLWVLGALILLSTGLLDATPGEGIGQIINHLIPIYLLTGLGYAVFGGFIFSALSRKIVRAALGIRADHDVSETESKPIRIPFALVLIATYMGYIILLMPFSVWFPFEGVMSGEIELGGGFLFLYAVASGVLNMFIAAIFGAEFGVVHRDIVVPPQAHAEGPSDIAAGGGAGGTGA